MTDLQDRAEKDKDFENVLQSAIHSFCCAQDQDIQDFLRYKAIDFQKRGLCRVYMYFDQEKIENGILEIEAFFTLSHKSLVTENISGSKVQKISGLKKSKTINFVLIGQLGKNVKLLPDGTYERSEISSRTILDGTFEIIRSASELIPCKCVLIECSDDEKVRSVYENYGFLFFQNDGDHNQYYKML